MLQLLALQVRGPCCIEDVDCFELTMQESHGDPIANLVTLMPASMR